MKRGPKFLKILLTIPLALIIAGYATVVAQDLIDDYYASIATGPGEENLEGYCVHFRRQMATGLLAPLLLAVLLVFEKRESLGGKLAVKPVLSCLFVLTALVVTPRFGAYAVIVVAGLVLCLAGDVCLAFPQRAMFRSGLVAFLLGHVAYIVAFASVAYPNWALWMAAVAAFLLVVFLPPLATLVGMLAGQPSTAPEDLLPPWRPSCLGQ